VNHPTSNHSAYYAALDQLDDALDDALAAIRAEQDSGRISVGQAATERAGVLERHLRDLAALRAEHLGPGE